MTEDWKPKTELGAKVKSKEIQDIDEILNKGQKILESEITDILIPNLESYLIEIGQSKGKFGGGKRSIWRQTQKKTKEGNKAKFATMTAVGNHDGYIGIGFGKSKETMPARQKSLRQAKLNITKIKRGCGSWECNCGEPHSIPFQVEGKCGSIKIILKPAPKGTGLITEDSVQKILNLAGIRDIYSKTFGQTKVRINLTKALVDALKQLSQMRVKPDYVEKAGVIDGRKK